MFKLLVICVAILVNVDAAPSAEPQGDIFVRIGSLVMFNNIDNENISRVFLMIYMITFLNLMKI